MQPINGTVQIADDMSFPVASDCPTETWMPCQSYVTIDDPCVSCDRLDFSDVDDVALWERNAWFATRRVWLATRGKYTGCCQTTFHPCADVCGVPNLFAEGVPDSHNTAMSVPVPVKGGWTNVWSCGCGSLTSCLCDDYAKLLLPYHPARELIDVTIGGTSVPLSTFHLDTHTNIVRRVDGQEWPRCNSVIPGDSNEWTVTYTFGRSLPPEAVPLVALYTCQLVKLCRREKCDLPVDYYQFRSGDLQYVVPQSGDYRTQLLTGFRPLDDWIVLDRGGRTIHQPRGFTYNKPLPNLGIH